jgi:uncharacterized spore protein YtfJ
VKRVFGEPIQQGPITLVPAAWVSGAGGGGGGEGMGPQLQESEQAQGKGFGSGFGLKARPAGAFIIRENEVRWVPAVDANEALRRVQIVVGALALLFGWRLARNLGRVEKRPWWLRLLK